MDVTSKLLPPKAGGKKIDEGIRLGLYCKFGVDLTAIEGAGALVGLTMLTKVGSDLSRFKTEKHFTSWLGLCPDNRISGGKVLSCRTRRVVNRLSDVLRSVATALEASQSALVAGHRRMKAKLGAAEGITATAHKLARIIYRLVKHGQAYVKQGMLDCKHKYQARKPRGLQQPAAAIGFQLVELKQQTPLVS